MKEFTPLVSVIIPVFNYGRFLSDALDSILVQSYENWECIIVDDGSTDNTREIASLYINKDIRIRYYHQYNNGVSHARNNGLAKANGKYVQFLDADDLLEKFKLEKHVQFLEENSQVDLVYSSILSFDDTKLKDRIYKPFSLEKPPVSGSGYQVLINLIYDNIFLPGCALATKKMYDMVGLFDTSLRGFEDWHYWYRAALLNITFEFDISSGTRLLSRSHGSNVSTHKFKMWTDKVLSREDIINVSQKLFLEKNLSLDEQSIHKLNNIHQVLLNRDKARLHLLYGNISKGFYSMMKHAVYSRKYYFAFYDGAYWLKERFLGKHK